MLKCGIRNPYLYFFLKFDLFCVYDKYMHVHHRHN